MVPWRQDIVLEEGICVQIKDPHSMRAEEKRMQLHQCITGSVSVKSFHSLKFSSLTPIEVPFLYCQDFGHPGTAISLAPLSLFLKTSYKCNQHIIHKELLLYSSSFSCRLG